MAHAMCRDRVPAISTSHRPRGEATIMPLVTRRGGTTVCDFTSPTRVALAPTPRSVGLARRFLRERRCPHHHAEVVDAAVLLVSELVTNAVRHASPPITLEVICENSHALQVRVSDATPDTPAPVDPCVHDEGGRGLAITQVLSDDWGVDPNEDKDGKTVWFRINSPV
jgi:anti-sigma regulatory factor (Ser/Thr protein kinase)